MALYSGSFSAYERSEQAGGYDWEQLFSAWLGGNIPAEVNIPVFVEGSLSQKISIWPLAAILLGQAQRQHQFPKHQLSPFFSSLSANLEHIIHARWEENTGLLYLQGPEESLLEDSDFWAQAPESKLADPSFLALSILALETLIDLGGQLQQDIEPLSQHYELLIHGVNEHLWNEDYGVYFPYDLEQQEQIVSGSLGGLLFWIADVPDQEQAEAMYRTLANNFVHPEHYYFPSQCILENGQSRKVNLLLNYLLFFGLTRFDFGATAKALRQHTGYLIEEYGVRAIFDSWRHPVERSGRQPATTFMSMLWQTMQRAPLKHYTHEL